MKSTLFFFSPVFYLCLPVLSQQQAGSEILHYTLQEVRVVESNTRFFCEDIPAFHVDPIALQDFHTGSLGDVLSAHSPALIRFYGPAGSLASLSLRGTGTNHTQVSWNGFAINSPTTGQADLSLIPSSFVQQVDLIAGASGALFGSGTFGGSVSLTNKPDWDNKVNLSYTLEGGSFGTLNNMLSLKLGNARIQYHLTAVQQQAQNNFTFTDNYKYGSPVEKRDHNAYRSTGFIQHVFVTLPRGNSLEAGMWLQRKSIELPTLMGTYTRSNALQKDSTFKTYLTYRKLFEKASLVLKSAYFTDNLRYTDKLNASDERYSIDSRIGAGRLMNEAEFRYYASDWLIVGTGASYNYLSGQSSNYGNTVMENEFSLSTFAKISLNKWIGNLGLRRELYEGPDPGLLYSMGWRYIIRDNMVLRTNISNKYRKPNFNEKYWKPGGNPDLRPEKGWGADAGFEGRLSGGLQRTKLDYSLSAFFQSVDNWIQWMMLDSLTPVEFKTVHSHGAEAHLSLRYTTEKITFSSGIIYSFTRSVITRTYDDNALYTGSQMPYVPLHAAKINLDMGWKGWYAGTHCYASGKRETIDSNDEILRLDGYFLQDIRVGYEKNYRWLQLKTAIRIENLWNTRYEVIRAYPMPGRGFYLSASIGFNRK